MTRPPWEPPLVSVITPTFRRAGWIAETLDSVLDQDYPAVELIVIDDGSDDDTPTILADYESRQGVTVITQPNSGQATAVNRGLEAASGEYLTLVSDDDPILPGALTRLVEVMEADDEVLVAYPDWYLIDPEGTPLDVVEAREYDLAHMLSFSTCLPGPCSLFRRRAVELVGGWDTRWRWCADFDFWLRIGLHGPMVRVPEVLATWRSHPDSQTVNQSQIALAMERIEMIRHYFRRDDLPPAVRELEYETMHNVFGVAASMTLPPIPSRWLVQDLESPVLRSLRNEEVHETDTVRWLHGEIARRDRETQRLRHRVDLLEQRLAELSQAAEDAPRREP